MIQKLTLRIISENTPEWHTLKACNNRLNNIENVLDLVRSDNPQKAVEAVRSLDRLICANDELCESSFYAIPHIIQLLSNSHISIELRKVLYDLLIQISMSGSKETMNVNLGAVTVICQIGFACHYAVHLGKALYIQDINHRNKHISDNALELLETIANKYLHILLSNIRPKKDEYALSNFVASVLMDNANLKECNSTLYIQQLQYEVKKNLGYTAHSAILIDEVEADNDKNYMIKLKYKPVGTVSVLVEKILELSIKHKSTDTYLIGRKLLECKLPQKNES